MRVRNAAVVLFGAVGLASCGDQAAAPLAPDAEPDLQRFERGTGLVLQNATETPIPLVNDLVFDGDLVITGLAVDPLGGIDATGTIQGTVTGPGTFELVDETFTTDVGISRTGGGGGCRLVTLDLAPIAVDASPLAAVDFQAIDVDARASGPVGPLLCAVTGLVGNAAGGALEAIVGVLNALLGGGGAPPVPPVTP